MKHQMDNLMVRDCNFMVTIAYRRVFDKRIECYITKYLL